MGRIGWRAGLLWLGVLVLPAVGGCTGKGSGTGKTVRFPSFDGLVMAGYQGWFNTPGDGAGLHWKHYQKGDVFAPGSCTIDLWPDMTEYTERYPTEFRFGDGTPATVFSSRDASTTDLHFRWMKEYGIDGAFVQRFVVSVKGEKLIRNSDAILRQALEAAEKYSRALCVMYDLSGMQPGDEQVLIDDWKKLTGEMRLTSRPDNHYLHHGGKPLVAVWGIGFDDNRAYGFGEAEKIVTFLKESGCSVLVGVPAHWRKLSGDALPDPRLHEIIMQADIVLPWLVGRFDMEHYPAFQKMIAEDVAWCREHGKGYVPVLFPGFSWHNLRNGRAPLDQIPRLGGRFFWRQAEGALRAGAVSLYLAMFDEIDEGTAFFKCTNRPPADKSPFLTYGEFPSDHYLWLAGEAARMLRGERPLSEEMPERDSVR